MKVFKFRAVISEVKQDRDAPSRSMTQRQAWKKFRSRIEKLAKDLGEDGFLLNYSVEGFDEEGQK